MFLFFLWFSYMPQTITVLNRSDACYFVHASNLWCVCSCDRMYQMEKTVISHQSSMGSTDWVIAWGHSCKNIRPTRFYYVSYFMIFDKNKYPFVLITELLWKIIYNRFSFCFRIFQPSLDQMDQENQMLLMPCYLCLVIVQRKSAQKKFHF